MSIIRSVRLQITARGMVFCCSGGLAVRRAAAWSYVLGVKSGIFLYTKHIILIGAWVSVVVKALRY
jgi:hypothetical protein